MPTVKHDLVLTKRYDPRRVFNRALLLLFGIPVFLVGFLLTSLDVLGQDKWIVTPSRGGAEGARAQAQMTAIHGAQTQQQEAIDALQATIDTSLTGVIGQ
ncbi:hypothetical protein, partial [Lutibaculum baratangense]|uniref:hypothetical protein n=1 Tax=Lutibaculum baratangense TaxID=1358440 RepID=UPI001AEC1940